MLSSIVSICIARVNAQGRNRKSKEVQEVLLRSSNPGKVKKFLEGQEIAAEGVPARSGNSSRKSTPRSSSPSKVKKSKQGKKSKQNQGQVIFSGPRSPKKLQAVPTRLSGASKVNKSKQGQRV